MGKKSRKPRPPDGSQPGSSTSTFAGSSTNAASSKASDLQRRRKQAQALESRFGKLNAAAVENLGLISAYSPLKRPIPTELGHFDEALMGDVDFKLPKKPRWHHDLTARAVGANEDSVFANWLVETGEAMEKRYPALSTLSKGSMEVKHLPTPGPRECLLPSQFERNVEVYRQLWRVMERSDVLLVLLDSRCPLLHLPPSLAQYLQRYASMRTILVLTKKDLTGREVADFWKEWLEEKYGWPVVVTESYRKEAKMEGQGRRSRFTPFLSPSSRTDLFAAIKKVHKTLTTPPARVRDDPEKLQAWESPCPADIDWDHVEGSNRDDEPVAASSTQAQDVLSNAASGSKTSKDQPSFTIGLIGQPNVGKSSLMNALMASKVVHASRTPGKTKHFQTHYLGGGARGDASETDTSGSSQGTNKTLVQLCDSPGLVFPSGAGSELQVLGAILPISQVQAISSVVRWIGCHLPLEEVLKLDYPPDDDDAPLLKGQPEAEKDWTATVILEALARRHNYKTAKAGRWDINRAGNALIRSLAEGRIPWAFWPPRAATSEAEARSEGSQTHQRPHKGIWLHPTTSAEVNGKHNHEQDAKAEGAAFPFDSASEGSDVDVSDTEDEGEQQERRLQSVKGRRARKNKQELLQSTDENDSHNSSEEESEQGEATVAATSLFDALAVEDGEPDSTPEESDEDSEADDSEAEEVA